MGLWSKVDKLEKRKIPTFQKVWTSYPITDPCRRDQVQWQCAVYLTTALAKSGIIGASGFDGKQGYAGNPTCRGTGDFQGMRLARGSQTLADYLHHRLFPPKRYGGGATTRKLLRGQKGIAFYRHIAGFTNQGGNRGSHIDLWNGPLDRAGSERQQPYKLGEYFDGAKEVYFWALA